MATYIGKKTLSGYTWYVWRRDCGDFVAHPATMDANSPPGIDGSIEIWGHTIPELERSAGALMRLMPEMKIVST